MKSLNEKEIEVIRYIAMGCTAKEIGKYMGLEFRTIEVYVGKLKRKLAARNIAHAIYLASQYDILN